MKDFPKSFMKDVPPLTDTQKNPPLPQEQNSSEAEAIEAIGTFETLDMGTHIAELEKKLIVEALKRTGNNHTKSIAMLGISRQTYYDRLKKLQL